MNITISELADLPKVQQLNSWLNRPSIRKVTIELPHLEEQEQAKAAKKIKHLFNDCGCLYGEIVMFSFLGWKIIPLALAGTFAWNMLLYLLPIAIGLGILAKLIGLYWSYQQLHSYLQHLKTNLQKESSTLSISKSSNLIDHESL